MRSVILTAMVILGMILAGCTGEDGSMGPTGPQGERGEQGPPGEDGAGTRIVYNSAAVLPDMDLYYFLIPEITLNDLPLVAIYCAYEGYPNEWAELPIFVEGMSGDGQFYYLTEGRVNVYNCEGLWIKIVLVI